MRSHSPTPSVAPGDALKSYRSGSPRTWPNSWQKTPIEISPPAVEIGESYAHSSGSVVNADIRTLSLISDPGSVNLWDHMSFPLPVSSPPGPAWTTNSPSTNPSGAPLGPLLSNWEKSTSGLARSTASATIPCEFLGNTPKPDWPFV